MGNWSMDALISWRQRTSGCSRSMNSWSCAWRARTPLTFQVAIFTAGAPFSLSRSCLRVLHARLAPSCAVFRGDHWTDGVPPRTRDGADRRRAPEDRLAVPPKVPGRERGAEPAPRRRTPRRLHGKLDHRGVDEI